MSTFSKFQQLRDMKDNNEEQYYNLLRNYAAQNQKPHPTTRRENSRQKHTVFADSGTTCSQICRKRVQQKPPHPKIRRNLCTLLITNKPVNRFAMQIN